MFDITSEDRFNPENNPLFTDYSNTFIITPLAEQAFYYIANLMYRDYTDDEVKSIFNDPKQLADDVADMINEFAKDDDKDYIQAVTALSCVLLYHFSQA